jgi:hypothetical protein
MTISLSHHGSKAQTAASQSPALFMIAKVQRKESALRPIK